MNEVLEEYTDTSGVYHLIVSTGDKTSDVIEYISLLNCPFCGRKCTDNMVCQCGKNNASIRI